MVDESLRNKGRGFELDGHDGRQEAVEYNLSMYIEIVCGWTVIFPRDR